MQAPTPGMYGYKLWLYTGSGPHDRIMLPYESECDTKAGALAEFQEWLNAKDIPDMIQFDNCSLRRSTIIRVDIDRG